jgi:PPOX class probable F420-dependent enzyme
MTELSPGGAAFVSGGRVARLGTADRSGHPLVVPVCYAYDGRRWYSAVDGKPKRIEGRVLRRVRHIEENPQVSVLIDHYDEDWRRLRYVIIHGTAALLAGGDEHAYALDLLRAKYPQYTRVALPGDGGVVIRVTPDAFVEWTFAA